MKTKSIIGLIYLLLACSSFGQQSMFALNNLETDVDAPVFDSEGMPLEGPGYLAELWGSATSDSLVPALRFFLPGGREIVPFDEDGYFSSSRSLVVPSMFDRYAWLQVRAWDADLGTTYEEAVARDIGGYGESPLFYAQGTHPLLEPPGLPARLIGLESFSLRPMVPEPSTWVLLLGGVGVWWASRRGRKS